MCSDNNNSADVAHHKKSLPERIPAFGLLMALLSIFCFSLGQIVVKIVTQMHSIQVLVFRSIFQFIFFTTITLTSKYSICGRSGHRWDLSLRCISGTISQITIFMAYRLMPVADAITIYLCSPVIVTVLAYFLLKEPITLLQAVIGTFALGGVVIIAKPEFLFGSENESVYESRLLGTLWASIACLALAFAMISLRKLKTTPVTVVVMWYSGTITVTGSVILLILNKVVLPTGLWTWSLLVGTGLCGIGEQFLMNIAFKYESAGPVSIVLTSSIVLSFILEVVLLSNTIEWTSICGACLVTACVIILAMVKWNTESPQLFEKMCTSRVCCFSGVRPNKSVIDFNTKPDSLRASNECIDLTIDHKNVYSQQMRNNC